MRNFFSNKDPRAYLFLFPAFLLLTVFVFIPMIQIFCYSLLDYNIFEGASFSGFSNFRRLFSDPSFWYAVMNSFIFILVTPLLIVASLSLALALRQTTKLNKFFRSVYFLPVVTPLVIAGIIWRWIFSEDNGLLNHLLSSAGIGQVPWLTKYPVNILSTMILTVWRGAGYYMMIFLAGLTIIPKEIEEAATLDGAGKIRQAIYILVPMLRPTLSLVFVVSSTAAVKIFTELYILIPGAPRSNKTPVYYLYQQAFERFDFGYASAAGVVLFVLLLGFSYMNVRLLERE